MMILIIGGSGSGKSAYAEEVVSRLAGELPKYYLATMLVRDEESEEKVRRHRCLREGKGFVTVEQPGNIREALEKMETQECCALLECMSNLAANEMFSGDVPGDVPGRILDGIRALQEGLTHFVVVSNNVFEDGVQYDEMTMAYLRLLGGLNRELAVMADRVVEVVAGIPLVLKDGGDLEI